LKSPEMEYVPCNLCGADDTELLFTSPDRMFHKNVIFNIVRCKHCGIFNENDVQVRMAVFSPLSASSALIRRCGQIKVIAEKDESIK